MADDLIIFTFIELLLSVFQTESLTSTNQKELEVKKTVMYSIKCLIVLIWMSKPLTKSGALGRDSGLTH